MGPSRETRRARISRPIVWAGERLRTGASPPRTGRRYGYGIKANTDWKATLGEHWRQYEETFPALAKSRIGQVSLECQCARTDRTDRAPQRQGRAGWLHRRRYVPADRLFPCTNCGMAPMASEIAYAKLTALAAGAKLARTAM